MLEKGGEGTQLVVFLNPVVRWSELISRLLPCRSVHFLFMCMVGDFSFTSPSTRRSGYWFQGNRIQFAYYLGSRNPELSQVLPYLEYSYTLEAIWRGGKCGQIIFCNPSSVFILFDVAAGELNWPSEHLWSTTLSLGLGSVEKKVSNMEERKILIK